jgi:hypothetical protein
MIVTCLGSNIYEVKEFMQVDTSYMVILGKGCSCGKPECRHIKAVNEWISKQKVKVSI